MKEAYVGKDARDDIKKDPKFTRLPSDTKKDVDKELEKGNIVDLGEDTLDEMEFFPVAVTVPDELPTPGRIYSALVKEAEGLVDPSYVEANDADLSVIVTFMRKSDAENYKEFAGSLGIPEEYIEEPKSEDEPEMEDELYEIVMDSNGNELFVDDVISVKGKKFRIGEGTDGKAYLFSPSGKQLLEISDPRAHVLIAASIREDLDIGHEDDEPDMLKQYVYDIATYAAKLYKQLDKYDEMPEEVDFPNWWQSKVILARDYISKAQHYLEFEEKQPALDAMALEGQLDERININPEAEATVVKFIKALAKKYSYGVQDAAFLIKQVLSNQGLDEAKQINERAPEDLNIIIQNIRTHGEESGDVQGTAAEYIFYIANAFKINLNNIKDYLFEGNKSLDDIAKALFGLEYDQLSDAEKEEIQMIAHDEETDPHPYNMDLDYEDDDEMYEDSKTLVVDDKMYDKLYDLIAQYVKDPDDVQREVDNLISGGLDALSDEVLANLTRDPDFLALYNVGEGKLKERFYHNYTGRYSTFEKDKRDFKRKELEAELGHETNDIGIFINDKLWKRLEVDPSMGYSFSEEARRRQAMKMKNSIEAGAERKGWKIPKVEISLIGSLK